MLLLSLLTALCPLKHSIIKPDYLSLCGSAQRGNNLINQQLQNDFKTAHLELFGSKVEFMMLNEALNLQRPIYKM